MTLDLPFIWAGIIALAVLMYVLLDGFDLGIGILFPFATPRERDVMMESVAPIWDGNETWLVLGGGGLLAAFPFAYGALMPALYIPILLMLLALILRGVAFEFRHHGRARGKAFWTGAFVAGSVLATVAQGLALGGFVHGVTLEGSRFAGRPMDFLADGYSLAVAAGLVAGYALLGATWVVWRTEGELQAKARRWAVIAAAATAVLLAGVSLWTLDFPQVAARWGVVDGHVDAAALLRMAWVPAIGLLGLVVVAWGLWGRHHVTPFLGAYGVFVSGYIGLAVGFYPNIVPYGMTFRQAANADNALSLMLVGVSVLLPAILGYTVWVYWLFRGKVGADAGYH
jgi:cytochrome d ubiquinol oxidase subunit II